VRGPPSSLGLPHVHSTHTSSGFLSTVGMIIFSHSGGEAYDERHRPRRHVNSSSLMASLANSSPLDHIHYRKRLNFHGPGYFRRPAHENTEVIFVGHEADENEAYFRGPTNIFVGRPTKIRKLFSSVPRPTKMRRIFVGRGHTDENTSLTVPYFRRPH
jgi:hypothetical protein